MNNPLLSITGVAKRFGEVEALTHVDLTINSGQVIGLVGEEMGLVKLHYYD